MLPPPKCSPMKKFKGYTHYVNMWFIWREFIGIFIMANGQSVQNTGYVWSPSWNHLNSHFFKWVFLIRQPYDGIMNHGITNAAHPRKSLMIKCKWRFMVFYSRDSHWEKIRHRSQGKHTTKKNYFPLLHISGVLPSIKTVGNWQVFLERIRNSIPKTEIIACVYIYI